MAVLVPVIGGGENVTPEVNEQTALLDDLLKTVSFKGKELLFLVNEKGEIVCPLVSADETAQLPTAKAEHIAKGYTAYGADGFVVGTGEF